MTRSADQLWTDYYEDFPIPQWVVSKLLNTAIRMLARSGQIPPAPTVAEIGGGGSHFAPWFLAVWPRTTVYTALDINEVGLATVPRGVTPRRCDILKDDIPPLNAGLVVSTGIIQHFQPDDMARAIDAHLALSRPGGLLLITFPRATPLYWACRMVFTWLGLFPKDLYERPHRIREVEALLSGRAVLIDSETVWSIGFSHAFVLARVRS